MSAPSKPILRLCEWGTCDTAAYALTDGQRTAITDAANRWRVQNRLNTDPLAWEGVQGTTLRARQFVGVVEAGGCTVEIYPKLDQRSLVDETVENSMPLLHNLLWMMQTAARDTPSPADTAALREERLSFADVWAWLLARNLERELRRGIIRQYVTFRDDLHTVRGRILVGQQATRLFDRYDKTTCEWQEFTADVPVNRVLRCACEMLLSRVRSRTTRTLLSTCTTLLDEAAPVDTTTAVRDALHLPRFVRTTSRFERSFRLALRLLRGTGQNLQTGRADTWVFLDDMNAVWEEYVYALLRARFGKEVTAQETIGYLLPDLGAGRMAQKPDLRLVREGKTVFIADAKYKHLTRGQNAPLKFARLSESDDATAAGRVLDTNDIRQLTVYAELNARNRDETAPPRCCFSIRMWAICRSPPTLPMPGTVRASIWCRSGSHPMSE